MPSKAKPASGKKKAAAAPRSPLARVRRLCLALPNTTEKVAWGAPTFRVGGKLFCMYSDNHHNDGQLALWIAAPAGAQAAFIAADPERFFRPPYVGVNGWLGVRIDRGLDWATVADLLEEAHRTIASPKRVVELGMQKEKPRGPR